MDLYSLLIVVVVLALVFWIFTAYVPIPQPAKNIVLAVFGVIVCVWLLSFIMPLGGHGVLLRRE